MTQSIIVREDGYEYTADINRDPSDTIPAGLAGTIAKVAENLIAMDKAVQELHKSSDMYKFYDGVYVTGVVIEWDGMPSGMVKFVDDEPTYVPFKQGEKIPKESE